MSSRRILRCVVVKVPVSRAAEFEAAASQDVLPWADPYILELIAKCQKEVKMDIERREREVEVGAGFAQPPFAANEAPPPPLDDMPEKARPDAPQDDRRPAAQPPRRLVRKPR